mmetsp:Transcript_19189/g.55707  ORF Transcript_19189/g.55707 Transcript_19189/m.55707 type:complete len:261 (-) Transcript_19189:1719-2501(-)
MRKVGGSRQDMALSCLAPDELRLRLLILLQALGQGLDHVPHVRQLRFLRTRERRRPARSRDRGRTHGRRRWHRPRNASGGNAGGDASQATARRWRRCGGPLCLQQGLLRYDAGEGVNAELRPCWGLRGGAGRRSATRLTQRGVTTRRCPRLAEATHHLAVHRDQLLPFVLDLAILASLRHLVVVLLHGERLLHLGMEISLVVHLQLPLVTALLLQRRIPSPWVDFNEQHGFFGILVDFLQLGDDWPFLCVLALSEFLGNL